MSRIPIITGVGLATPLGIGLSRNWAALYEGHYLSGHAIVPGFDGRPRLQELAAHVAVQACAQAGLASRPAETTAVIVGTSKGPVTDWLDPHSARPVPPAEATSDNIRPTGGLQPCDSRLLGLPIRSFGLSDVASYVAGLLRIEGPRLTLSAACASGLHALIRAAMMVQSGEVRRALVIAAESSVHPLFVGSFQRLGVLADEAQGCRPFDTTRGGFFISEAAAAVVVEGLDRSAGERASGLSHPLARIERFALAGDATHLTGGDSQGGVLRHVLAQVVDGRPVDLVHAHGTGTIVNDPIELAAIDSVLSPGSGAANLYSHKGALGHSLGAAGLVSVVLNCASHGRGVVLPNVRTTSPLPLGDRLVLSREPCHRPVRRSLAIAAGFGGAMAALSLVSP